MPGDQSLALPEELSWWLEERATETGRSEDEVLARAVMAHRLVEDGSYDVPDLDELRAIEPRAETVEELDDRVSEIESDAAALGDDVDRLEDERDEQITDVRERIVEVLREVDSKASADHSHAEIEAAVTDVESALATLDDRLTRLDDDVASASRQFDDVVDEVDDLESKLAKLANAAVQLQRRVSELEGIEAKRSAVADLQAVANRHEITTADCERCDRTVHLGLLAEPQCPHCDSLFDAFEPPSGLFGNARLTIGDRPALDGATEDDAQAPGEFFADE